MRLLGSALTLNEAACSVLGWLLHPMAHIHPSKMLHCFHGDGPVLVHHYSSACLALSGFSTENEGHSPGLSYSSQKSHPVQDAAGSPFCSVQRGHALTTLLGQNAASGKGRHEHCSDTTLQSSMAPSALEKMGGVGAVSSPAGSSQQPLRDQTVQDWVKWTGEQKKGGRCLKSITPRKTPQELHSRAKAKQAAEVKKQNRALWPGIATGCAGAAPKGRVRQAMPSQGEARKAVG